MASRACLATLVAGMRAGTSEEHPDSRRLERERHPFTTEEVDRVLWRAGDVACGATDQSFERRALLLGC